MQKIYPWLNPFPNDKFYTLSNWKSLQTISDLMEMAENFPIGWKTLWEKEKLLVTSNFSFSHSVFRRLIPQTHENQGLLGKGVMTELGWSLDLHKIFELQKVFTHVTLRRLSWVDTFCRCMQFPFKWSTIHSRCTRFSFQLLDDLMEIDRTTAHF